MGKIILGLVAVDYLTIFEGKNVCNKKNINNDILMFFFIIVCFIMLLRACYIFQAHHHVLVVCECLNCCEMLPCSHTDNRYIQLLSYIILSDLLSTNFKYPYYVDFVQKQIFLDFV